MVGWHHRFSGHQFEQIPRDSEVHGVAKSQTHLSDWTVTPLKSYQLSLAFTQRG